MGTRRAMPPLRVARGDVVSGRLQTTREHTLTLLRAAWPDLNAQEKSDETGTRIAITASDGTPLVLAWERTVNKAWSVAMSRARARVEARVPIVDQIIAQAETEADRLRRQRRRIIDTLNGFETDEVTK